MQINNSMRCLFCLSMAIYSCNTAETNAKKAASEKIKIARQGVNIDYTDSQAGDTVLFFIHGWGINQTYWASQVAAFAPKYRVVTIDLPGFGKSGKKRNSWTVEDYAKDISAVLAALDLKHTILVGHSMSGAVAVETALTNPSRVIGVIGVDNLKDIGVIITPKMKAEWGRFYSGARYDFKKTVAENMLQYLFSPSTDSTVRTRVAHDILKSDTSLAVDCLENADQYAFVPKLKALDKTIYLINSDFMPTDTLAFQRNKIGYKLFHLGKTGHYPMLEKPGDFNNLLQQAIDKISGG